MRTIIRVRVAQVHAGIEPGPDGERRRRVWPRAALVPALAGAVAAPHHQVGGRVRACVRA